MLKSSKVSNNPVILLTLFDRQVRTRSGEFIPVPCIPGAILINIADLMQRWTSDQFVSVVSEGDISAPRFYDKVMEMHCNYKSKCDYICQIGSFIGNKKGLTYFNFRYVFVTHDLF